MISQSHIRAYSFRPEEVLVESARERLITLAIGGAAMTREPRLVVPEDALARLLAAIHAWRRSPSVVPAT
jgi:hypothetical protein